MRTRRTLIVVGTLLIASGLLDAARPIHRSQVMVGIAAALFIAALVVARLGVGSSADEHDAFAPRGSVLSIVISVWSSALVLLLALQTVDFGVNQTVALVQAIISCAAAVLGIWATVIVARRADLPRGLRAVPLIATIVAILCLAIPQILLILMHGVAIPIGVVLLALVPFCTVAAGVAVLVMAMRLPKPVPVDAHTDGIG